ncbi:DNA translocase FtsK [Kaistia adipata]|uniref:DNA translocase FtsK n=1 Tax=Kaistia adipata TaxID=166954 RepID=UPI0003FADAD5|nr:DNA translocase FtsK [Kaistia adipata]
MRSSNRPPQFTTIHAVDPTSRSYRDREAPSHPVQTRSAAPPASRDEPVLGPDGEPLPTWLQPFTAGMNARFTRTPDYLRRPRQAEPEVELAAEAEVVADVTVEPVVEAIAPEVLVAPEAPVLVVDEPVTEPVAAAPEIVEPAAALVASNPAPTPPVASLLAAFAPRAATTILAVPAPVAGAPEPAVEPTAPVAEIAAVVAPAAPEAPAAEADRARELAAAAQPSNIRRLERLIQVGRSTPVPGTVVGQAERSTAPEGRVSRPVAPAPRAPVPPAVVAPVSAEPAPVAPEPVAAAQPVVPEAPAPVVHADGSVEATIRVWFEWPRAVAPTLSLGERARKARWERRGQLVASAAPAALAVVAPQPAPADDKPVAPVAVAPVAAPVAEAVSPVEPVRAETTVSFHAGEYELPPLELLAEPPVTEPPFELSAEYLDQNSTFLQQTLRDFGVRGEIIDANPGPVVTLYELEPAPGTKSSRVIGLSGDIARSMSAVSARVAVVEGRNVIGIELPNQTRETVWLRELMASEAFAEAKAKLGLCLGKTIGGEPVIADLARMPHLLVAGTTGSGKSVAINTMILSLLYRHRPEECRLIMIDPKMLELSVYEGIPHLLTPVVTDPKKAVTALKWAVREMEERYRKMSRLGVRNIDGYNVRVAEARANGEVITRIVETGFDRSTGEMTQEEQVMDLTHLPYIVVIIDEMADLMMVAGKDIESAVQRLAQMARAAGIHLVMATQRPSVDVITGTIKANFPTRISFQVTSKIDSRTILGEMGAEQLLGQGDMLFMAGGGRIQRVHGPFVSDLEVEHVVDHLKRQGRPEYLDAVTAGDEEEEAAAPEEDVAVFDKSAMGEEGDAYEQAVALVLRDRKASTSYIQRRLQVGYNRAASIMERMEQEGIVGPANHAGKREIFMER